MGGRLLDWLGAGAASAIPDPVTAMPSRIVAGSTAVYFATDTKHFFLYDPSGPSWFDIDTAALTAITTESIQDMIAAFLQAGTGITLAYNDAGNQLTINCGVTQYTDEMAMDAIAAMIAAGTQVGISITYDDAGNKLSFNNTITQYTDEMAQDAVAALIAAGTDTGLTLTYDDVNNKINITVSTSYIDARITAASIDALTDVDTTTTVPTDGQVLSWHAATSKWIPATATGGSSTPWSFKPPTASNFSTTYASFRGGSSANAVVGTNDSDVGAAFIDSSTDNSNIKPFGRPIPTAFRGTTGNFSVKVHIKMASYTTNDQCGLWVRANVNQYIFFGLFNRGVGALSLQRAYYNSAWNDGSFGSDWLSDDIWLRIDVVNQTTSYFVSADGKNWQSVYGPENLFSAAFTDYGMYVSRFSSANPWYMTCDYLVSSEYP